MRPAWAAVLAGGAAVAIGTPASAGSAPVAQPQIAYVRGAISAPAVWFARIDGSHARRLGPGTHPLLSPNGGIVAASRLGSSGSALVLYFTAGGAARRFFRLSIATAVAQSWSPDSRYLAVSLASTNPASARPSGLAVIDTQTLRRRILAHGPIHGASFASDGSDRLAYASARSLALGARVNVHVVRPDGTLRRTITRDGRSLNPVWGSAKIAFDHERLRRHGAPVYQIWLMRPDGSHRSKLSHLRVAALSDGLVPLSFSASGSRLLAEYVGQDKSEAWTVAVASRGLRKLRIRGHIVSGAAISRDGTRVLVDRGGFLNQPDAGVVESLPFNGGKPSVLTHGAEPSWNR